MLYLYVRKLGGVALYEVYAVQQTISEPTLRADHLHRCMCVTHSSGSGQFLYMIALFLKSVESVCRSIGIDVCAYCIWVMQFYIIVLYMWSATCLFRSFISPLTISCVLSLPHSPGYHISLQCLWPCLPAQCRHRLT